MVAAGRLEMPDRWSNLVYDKSAKRYVASSKFSPAFIELDADRYLKAS